MAIAQNVGRMLTALPPALFAWAAPPGSKVPLIVGSLALLTTVIAALAAWSAREAFQLPLEKLGEADVR